LAAEELAVAERALLHAAELMVDATFRGATVAAVLRKLGRVEPVKVGGRIGLS
jgi:hypothetical protein